MLGDSERCETCGVRYMDHMVQNRCKEFLSGSEAKKLAEKGGERKLNA